MAVNYEQGLENKMYEDALLGFILTEPERMLDVVEILPDASFFADPTNRAAYAIFLDLHAKDAFPSDPALTIRELYTGGNSKNKKHFTTMAEAERYVVSLLDAPISNKFDPNLYREYAQRIKWSNDVLKIKNVAMSLLSDVEKVPFNEREEFISDAETKFGDITMSVHDKEGLVHISSITNSVRTVLENLHQGIAPTAGVKTGVGSLDRMIGGFNPGEVIVLAGRPGSGKTALSLQIAYNIASRPNDIDGKQSAVLMFSLEMMEDQLVNRMIALMARVNTDMFNKEYQHLLQGFYKETYSPAFEKQMKDKLEEQYWRSIIALKHLDTLPFYSTTTSGLSVNAIKSMIMQKQREVAKKGQKLGLVIIDYLQLMTPGLTKSNASRTEEVGDMSRRIKVIAKEFNVPILLLAQLNRDAEVNERPQLKNLRESGSIEQDADKVLFIYNPNALKTAAEFTDYQDEKAKYEALNRELMKEYISVAKNRQGNSGDCEVIFDKGFQTFVSQSDGYSGSGETFDEFAIKYYDKTRSGADIFWPLTDDKMIPELLQHREPEIQELPWLRNDGTVQRSKERSSGGSMRVQSSRPARPNPGYTPPQPQQAKPERPQYDRSTPATLPELDDLEADFDELEDEPLEAAVMSSQANAVSDDEQAYLEKMDDVPWEDDPQQEVQTAAGDAYSFDEEDEELDLNELDILTALSQELGRE